MKIVLESIQSDDARGTAELTQDEVLQYRIMLNIDGKSREFRVFFRTNVLSGLNANLVYGDELIEELLRFEPGALNTLYSTLGKHRRGKLVSLPLVVLDQSSNTTGVPAGP